MADAEKIYDVLVVGAGISGLSAAKILHEDGQDVLVLEARNRVGGRLYTLKDPAFQYSDLGGSYIGPTQNRIFRMAKELGVENYKIHASGNTIAMAGGSKWAYRGNFPTIYNPLVNLDLNNLVRTINEFVDTVPMAAPWKCDNAVEWDSMTAKEWFDKICWTKEARNLAYFTTRTVFATGPEEISFLYFLWYLRVGHGFLRVLQTEDGAQERKFVGGSQQICEKMADVIGKDKVIYNSPVISIKQNEKCVEVGIADGSVYKAKYVISALPPTLLGRISFSPSLSPHKAQLIQRIPMGSVIKTIHFYKRPFWREKGYCGMAETDMFLAAACDDTKPDGSNPALVGFINAKHAREMTSLSKDERKRKLCELYADMFESDEALHPVNYIEHNWLSEEFSGGCYVGVTPPGVLTQFGSALREPHGNVYFAGTETATEWAGYMDGGVQAGERAAREVLHSLGRISEEEIWQEEPESPDVPVVPLVNSKWERILPSVPGFLKLITFSAFVLTGALIAVAGNFKIG